MSRALRAATMVTAITILVLLTSACGKSGAKAVGKGKETAPPADLFPLLGGHRLAATPRTSAALYYNNYYAQHASDRRVRTCLGLAVVSRNPTVPVRCLMGRP